MRLRRVMNAAAPANSSHAAIAPAYPDAAVSAASVDSADTASCDCAASVLVLREPVTVLRTAGIVLVLAGLVLSRQRQKD